MTAANQGKWWITLMTGQRAQDRAGVLAFMANDPEKFKAVLEYLRQPYTPFHQRAAWAVGKVMEEPLKGLLPSYPVMIELLQKENIHNAIQRNLWRGLQYQSIPGQYEGEILDLAIRTVESTQMAIAVRVFALQVAYQIGRKYPEVCRELRQIIEGLLPYGSPGLKSRGKRILSKLP